MSDNDKYYNAKFDTIDDIKAKLSKMDLGQLRKISHYCDTIKSEQSSFIDDTAKCKVCGKILFRPRRGRCPNIAAVNVASSITGSGSGRKAVAKHETSLALIPVTQKPISSHT